MRLRATTSAKATALVAVTAAGLGLAGCGGETVDSSDVTKSSAPTSATSGPSSASSAQTTASSTATSTSSVVATSTVTQPSAAPAPGAEQPAREVTSMPEQASHYSADEQKFLDDVRNKGVNVNGVEDQLTATGRSVCDGTTFTRDAVAGQLVEQRRTDLDPAAAAQLIDETAHARLC